MRSLPPFPKGFDAVEAPSLVLPTTPEVLKGLQTGLGKSIHGHYPSTKIGNALYSGQAQLDAMRVLDLRTDVMDFTTFPLEVRIAIDGTAHAWFPDLGVMLEGGRRAVLDFLTPREMAFFRKHNLVQAMVGALAQHGISYVAYDTTEFAASVLCRNAAYVASFRQGRVDETIAPAVHGLIRERGAMSLQAMKSALGQVRGAVSTVCSMAWAEAVALDLRAASPLEMLILPHPNRGVAQ
ncbi:MAG: hypothetical protein DI532_23435 [Azospirillum brasilense]|nr:MAG: hypothetical protein DI532_23435 [Azospirillum brasilense]